MEVEGEPKNREADCLGNKAGLGMCVFGGWTLEKSPVLPPASLGQCLGSASASLCHQQLPGGPTPRPSNPVPGSLLGLEGQPRSCCRLLLPRLRKQEPTARPLPLVYGPDSEELALTPSPRSLRCSPRLQCETRFPSVSHPPPASVWIRG